MIKGTEGDSWLTFKINGKRKEQEFDWKNTIASVIVALQCTILPLDFVAFPTEEDAFFFYYPSKDKATFCLIFPTLHCFDNFLWDVGFLKFYLKLGSFLCCCSFSVTSPFLHQSGFTEVLQFFFSCSSFPKLIFLAKSYIRVFLISLVFKWGTGLAYCIWFQNSLCLNIFYSEASRFISDLNPLGSWKYCFTYIYIHTHTLNQVMS